MDEKQQQLTQAVTRRLKEADKFWHQACEDYQDLDEFLSSLNALIQALRNVTFILQSNKECIPDFDIWYKQKQDDMRADELMKWLHDARTIVVHKSDLKVKSTAKVSAVNWEEFQFGEVDVDPLTKTEEIAVSMPSKLADEVIRKGREPAIKLERRWIVESLPDYEILNALAICYVNLKAIVKEAYQKTGIPDIDLEQSLQFEKSNFILLKKVPDENRVVYIDLKDGAVLNRVSRQIEVTDEQKQEVGKHYGVKKGDLPGIDGEANDPFAFLEMYFEMSKKILVKDGDHVPMVHLFHKDGQHDCAVIPTRDKTQQYLIIRDIAETIRKQKIGGLIFILEEWVSSKEYNGGEKGFPPDDPNKRDALAVIAVREDGKYEARLQFFHKDGEKVILDEIQVLNDLSDAFWLAPILEAWNILIKR